jgi:hypothetical protein
MTYCAAPPRCIDLGNASPIYGTNGCPQPAAKQAVPTGSGDPTGSADPTGSGDPTSGGDGEDSSSDSNSGSAGTEGQDLIQGPAGIIAQERTGQVSGVLRCAVDAMVDQRATPDEGLCRAASA